MLRSVVMLFAALSGISYGAGDFRKIYLLDDGGYFLPEPFEIMETEIGYDGAPAVYNEALLEPGTIFAVRFTPASSCSLTYITAAGYSDPPGVTGEVIAHVYSDSQGAPGAELISPFSAVLTGNLIRARINLPQPVEIGSGDFYIGLEYTRNPPPFLTLDSGGGTGRSRYRVPEGDWMTIGRNDLNIRAWVNYFDNDTEGPSITARERIIGFSLEGDHPIGAAISDPSGVTSASVFYSTDGIDYNETVMENTTGNNWTGHIPGQPAGNLIRYYIFAVDGSPNGNESTYPSSGYFIMEIMSGLEIAYDDEIPEAWYILANDWDENKFAVKFRPEIYPVTITGARAMVDGIAPFDFTIASDRNGLPGDTIAGPMEAFEGRADWAVAEIPEYERPSIYEGSFWLIFNWRQETPASPAVGTDRSDPHGNSYSFRRSAGWHVFAGGDFIMRVIADTPTGTEEIGPEFGRPEVLELTGNYPNPFNPSTEISYYASHQGKIRLDITDIMGRKIKGLIDGRVPAGRGSVIWYGDNEDGKGVSSGVYYCVLSWDKGYKARKITLLK